MSTARRQKAWFAPLRYSSIDTAAFSPAPMASTTEAGPVTASPPAKTQGSDVRPLVRSAAK